MSRKKSNQPLKLFASVFVILAVLTSLIILSFSVGSRPVSKERSEMGFVVRKGETVDSIGKNLEAKNLIRSAAVFKFTVMKLGIAQYIQAGSFVLSSSMSTSEIAKSLTSGRQDFWITVLEGWRREELAEALATSFEEVGIPFNKETFLTITKGKEGMLFPDTYLLPLSISEEEVASLLINTFNKKVDETILADISNQGKTLNQVLTLASLIEREARTDQSRKIVAGILQNRLDINMALQVDASLQYAKGYDPIQKDWWATPLAIDKNIKSPYNTYAFPGLPPGPICSPSLSSIMAVIYPTPNDYLYYITDNNGNMHYAKTLETHNLNVNKYLR